MTPRREEVLQRISNKATMLTFDCHDHVALQNRSKKVESLNLITLPHESLEPLSPATT